MSKSAFWIIVLALLNGCSAPNCAYRPHVPLKTVAQKIELRDVYVGVSYVANVDEVHYVEGLQHVRLPAKGCYWVLEVRPMPAARIKRIGAYLFDAASGRLLSSTTNVIDNLPVR